MTVKNRALKRPNKRNLISKCKKYVIQHSTENIT